MISNKYIKSSLINYKISITNPNNLNNSRGIYLREYYENQKINEFNITVLPVFKKNYEIEEKLKFEKR
jgi:hypothetical protein